MTSTAKSPEEYFSALPEDRKAAMNELRRVIQKNIPEGFEEQMTYGMIGYVVPHSLFPAGYHCDPSLPLGLVSIASQKNFIAVYHMGIYSSPDLLKWFTDEFPKHSKRKLDMGKSCIRFKKIDEIPYDLIGELMTKMTVQDWISTYEKALNQQTKK
jgi:uncharacterized protein YdhG (YjbR/CyaY superfamily)